MLRAIWQKLSPIIGSGTIGKFLYRLRHVRKIKKRKDLFIMHIEGCADSLRKKEAYDFSLKTPLNFPLPAHSMRLAAIVHIFYPELAREIKTALRNVPVNIDVYVSTPEENKKRLIELEFQDFSQGKVDVRVKKFPEAWHGLALSD